MTATSDIRLLLELYADGEIDERDRREVERALETDAAAREYLLALEEMREIVALPIERATESVSFDGLFARVSAAIDMPAAMPAMARDSELEMLAMAMADGERLDAGDRARVDAYLTACAPARDGVAGLAELAELVRAPIERAADRVDFDLLSRRIDVALDQVDAERAAASAPVAETAPSLWSRFVDFVGGHRGLTASVVTAAAVAAITVPMMGNGTGSGQDPTTGGTTVINNYYLTQPEIDDTSVERGFALQVQEGDPDSDFAPVIWIVPEDKPEDSYFDEPRPSDDDAGRPL